MMEKRIAILGGDKRFSILAQQMVHDGHKIMTYGHENDCAAYEVPLDEAVTAEYIVLPLPLARLEEDLNGRKDCTMEQLWSKFYPGQKIYAGNIREKDRECAGMHGLRLVDYYTDEALAIRNAVPTAEGAIAAAMSAGGALSGHGLRAHREGSRAKAGGSGGESKCQRAAKNRSCMD